MSDDSLVDVGFRADAFTMLAGPAPTKEEARDALIELFVLAASSANYRYTEGASQKQAEHHFMTAMRRLLESD